jgi:hypothetical protein
MAISLVPTDDDGSPRTVTLFRRGQEVSAVGVDDAYDAARQTAIMVLQQDKGLMVGDVIQITRI